MISNYNEKNLISKKNKRKKKMIKIKQKNKKFNLFPTDLKGPQTKIQINNSKKKYPRIILRKIMK